MKTIDKAVSAVQNQQRKLYRRADSAEHIKKNILEFRRALINRRMYIDVDTVSKSGMSRTLRLRYVENNRIYFVSESYYCLFGMNAKGRIDGCGMDMRFHAAYTFAQLTGDSKKNNEYANRVMHCG